MSRYRSRSRLRLGMPHTVTGGLSEVALLAHAGDLRWIDIATAAGAPVSHLRDAEGRPVYATFYFVAVDGLPEAGLAAFQPDDELEMVSTLVRFGRSMLDGEHALYPSGTLPLNLPPLLPPAPHVRLSNVFVSEGSGPQDLRIAAPANGRIEDIPAAPAEPDSYRMIKEARREGRFFAPPLDATPLWPGVRTVAYSINPDRDVNGVGLVYFANYVAIMDFAERRALEEAGHAPAALDGRVTLRRRIGYYGNAQRHDTLAVEVEAFALPGARSRLLLHYRIRRATDGRLMAVSSAEKALRESS